MNESYIVIGDCREAMREMPEKSVHCCVTSPPYWGLRDYGVAGQLGLERTPEEYVAVMVGVFREVRRVLRDDGTLWLNLGDSYARGFGGGSPGQKSATNVGSFNGRTVGKLPAGLKGKDLVGIPWMVAFALRADGWYLRSDIIWHKPNPMPESVTDRPTKAHEYIFLLSKSQKYYYNHIASAEEATSGRADMAVKGLGTGKAYMNGNKNNSHKPDKQSGHGRRHAGFNGRYAARIAAEGNPGTRNRRSVWTVATKPFKEAHFATFPPDLIEPCILAGCPAGGTVLDPFFGAGTTGLVAQRLGRTWIGCELSDEYAQMAFERISQPS